MKIFNFDEYVERRGTDSRKWNIEGMYEMADYADEESIPVWVADMDFKIPPIIIKKLKERLEHEVLGYGLPSESYYESIKWWNKKRNNSVIEKQWIISTPGVVPALNFAVRAFTNIGDGVIVQNPVYPPFKAAVMNNERNVYDNTLVIKDGKYEIDFLKLEELAKKEEVKLMIFCSPHNPVGKVWSKEELEKVAKICYENSVILIADEIHSDLVLFGNKFETALNLDEKLLQNIVVCTAPSKTFNIAGLQTSNIIIPNEKLRGKFTKIMFDLGLKTIPNIFGAIALEAAYSEAGEKWLEELKKYLEENYLYIKEYFSKNFPDLKLMPLEGTYLVWIDFRNCKYSEKELKEKIEKEAKIVLDGGEIFGESGKGFARINIACPRVTLENLMKRFKLIF